MNRQPTLFEMLADNTNNIRPEVADLLMQSRHALQAQAARQPIPPPPPQARARRGGRWMFFCFIALLLCLSFIFLKNQNPRQPGSVATMKKAQMITMKTGKVFGDSVSVRTQPNLRGEIIKNVNQNEILVVTAFSDGWYRVALSDHSSGYIFGAYILPQDFDPSPYYVVLTKDNYTKLLVRTDNDPLYFSVLWPDGQTTRILKENVAIYKYY